MGTEKRQRQKLKYLLGPNDAGTLDSGAFSQAERPIAHMDRENASQGISRKPQASHEYESTPRGTFGGENGGSPSAPEPEYPLWLKFCSSDRNGGRQMTARQYFDHLLEVARDAERTRRQLGMLETSMLRGAGRDAHAEAIRHRLERDERAIASAQEFVFGNELAATVDARAVDVLWLKYACDATWRQVARQIGYSVSQAQQIWHAALRAIDAAHLLDGAKS